MMQKGVNQRWNLCRFEYDQLRLIGPKFQIAKISLSCGSAENSRLWAFLIISTWISQPHILLFTLTISEAPWRLSVRPLKAYSINISVWKTASSFAFGTLLTLSSTLGIMDPAYFVGRKELLAWINSFLELDYTKVEQMATGACFQLIVLITPYVLVISAAISLVLTKLLYQLSIHNKGAAYVQLMDAAFPGQIPLSKANFNAQYDYEFSGNFKILQTHLVKIKCDKVVPTDRLVKAKYQDNLEFMQWMKRFFEMQFSGEPYDAKARRKECKCEYASDKSSTKKATSTASHASSGSTGSSASDARRSSMMPGTGSTTKPVRQSLMPARTTTAASTRPTSVRLPPRDNRVEELTSMCSELTIELTKSETSREFYLDKLRAIESLMGQMVVEEETAESLRDKVHAILFKED